MSRDDVVALLQNHAPVERDEERQARERIAAALQALPRDPSPLCTLGCQLDQARAEFDKTGDPGVAWRIGELYRAIKTTPPGTFADCLTKLAVAADLGVDGSEEDWVLLDQVDKYFAGG